MNNELELNFDKDPREFYEYVYDTYCEAQSGDSRAMSYIEYLWDTAPYTVSKVVEEYEEINS